jgi:hypothetical protein
MLKIVAMLLGLCVGLQPSLNIFGQVRFSLVLHEKTQQVQDQSHDIVEIKTDELVEKRTVKTKHYPEESGFRAEISPFAIHYWNEEVWEDIGNTLIEAVDKSGNSVIQNKNNSFQVQFAADVTSNLLWSIVQDSYVLSWDMDLGEKTIVSSVNNPNESGRN